jgi:hypothetical protein
MKYTILKVLSTIVILISSTLYASPNTTHSFPVIEGSSCCSNLNDKVKPYEWYEQRTQQMMQRVRESEHRFNQIKREHDWHR